MKWKMKLEKLFSIAAFPTVIKDGLLAIAKESNVNVDELELKRSAAAKPVEELEEGSRTAVKYVSYRSVDRDGEIVVPSGIVLSEFRKSPSFFWGHDYREPPIGSDEWIIQDEFGLKAKSVYADTGEGTMADIVWRLVHQGHQKSSSIGFVPVEWVNKGDEKFDKVFGKLVESWKELAKTGDKLKRIITKAVLLEHSDVGIPANVDAQMVTVAKSFGANDDLCRKLYGEIPPAPPKPQEVSLIKAPAFISVVREPVSVQRVDVEKILKEQLDLARGRV